ncbi:Beta-lactamase enzyme family protein [Nonomuraea maritima]|uniref:Beta-lactamase enzyme family protein n=1 Tax=Nonomuraea maritima TaxID=683260 RepID=A0A1G8V0T2_9ACTN|nr:serine hydrolase [Nonomuraea maritima]SDJ59706.1 Beta-lactamase enzyme family protein [Nonomuraea maritima]
MYAPSKPIRLLAAASVAITVSACVSAPFTAQATPVTADATVAGPQIPDTPAGRQLTWVLDAVTRAPVPESELREHFAADFLASVPPAQLNQFLASVADMRLERLSQSSQNALVAEVTTLGEPYTVRLGVDGDGLIIGLLVEPVTPPPTAPRSWAELDERLASTAPRTGFLAAELASNGTCRPVHAVSAGTAFPLGSMIKLYVLGAVSQAVEKGAFGWDTELTVTPELRSLGVGGLADRPDGSEVTVLEAARLMISISDNTATDLLIHKVGRKAVERTMRAWGAHDKRNVPVLTTRELFVLKGVDHPGRAEHYLSLGDAKQRAYLKGTVARTPLSRITPWTSPRELDRIEYFASPSQICRAYAGLVKLRDRRVDEIMSINDAGLGLDRASWPRVWFKGGSEVGLSDVSFLARTSTGTSYVVTMMAVNTGAPLSQRVTVEQVALAKGAFTLAARR